MFSGRKTHADKLSGARAAAILLDPAKEGITVLVGKVTLLPEAGSTIVYEPQEAVESATPCDNLSTSGWREDGYLWYQLSRNLINDDKGERSIWSSTSVLRIEHYQTRVAGSEFVPPTTDQSFQRHAFWPASDSHGPLRQCRRVVVQHTGVTPPESVAPKLGHGLAKQRRDMPYWGTPKKTRRSWGKSKDSPSMEENKLLVPANIFVVIFPHRTNPQRRARSVRGRRDGCPGLGRATQPKSRSKCSRRRSVVIAHFSRRSLQSVGTQH